MTQLDFNTLDFNGVSMSLIIYLTSIILIKINSLFQMLEDLLV